MGPAEGSRTLLASTAVALVAVGCCVGLPLLGGALAGVTLAAILGVGGGLLLLIASIAGTIALLRARARTLPPEAGSVRVEVLYFDGCPSHEALLPRLRELLASRGIVTEIELRAITDDEAAKRERFLGSPTVRVNGRDVEPEAERRTDFGMKCRLYRSAGGVSGQPPQEWLRAAIGDGAGAPA